MTVQNCPYCREDKPVDGLVGHVMLTSDERHGALGELPPEFEDFDASNVATGTPEADDAPAHDAESGDQSESDPLRTVAGGLLYLLDSVSLSMAIVGSALVVAAATALDGAWAAILGLLGGLAVVVCLGFYLSLSIVHYYRE